MNNQDIPMHWKKRIAEDPNSEFAKKALDIQEQLRTKSFSKARSQVAKKKSNVGTLLLERFKKMVDAVPCSDCKRTMVRLDFSTVEEIRDKHNAIVIEIEKNAHRAKSAWWSKLMMKADEMFTDGVVTRLLISKFLTEACDEDAAKFRG